MANHPPGMSRLGIYPPPAGSRLSPPRLPVGTQPAGPSYPYGRKPRLDSRAMPWAVADRYRVFGAVLAVLGGLAAAGIVPAITESIAAQYACATSLLALAIIVAIWLDWRRNGDKLSVLTLIGAFYMMAFVLASVFVWFKPSWAVSVPVHFVFSHDALTKAEWLCLLCWVCFAVGYRLGLFGFLPIPRLSLAGSESRATQRRALIVLYVIGTIARLVGIPRGLYFHPVSTSAVASGSTLNQILGMFGTFPLIAVAYLGIRAHQQRSKRLRRYYWAALAIEFAWALPSGNRVDSVRILVLAVVVFYYTHRRLPLKAMAVCGIFGLFFVFPVLYLYRNANETSSFSKNYQVSNLGTGVQTYTSGSIGNTLLFGLGSTLSRFADIQFPAALEERGRQGYSPGEGATVGWIFTNLVPHAIDPTKQSIIQFTDQLAYNLRLTPVRNSSFAPTVVGEFYLDFGAVGAAIAMLILGATYREIDKWLANRRTVPMVTATYAALAYTIISTQEPLLAIGLEQMIRNLILIAILIRVTTWLLRVRDKGHATTASRDRAQRWTDVNAKPGHPPLLELP